MYIYVYIRELLKGNKYIYYIYIISESTAVMPLDVLGCTRVTLIGTTSQSKPWLIDLGTLTIPIVLGINHCNYWFSTRNL